MDAPTFNGEAGALFSDPEWNEKRTAQPPTPVCRDCREKVYAGGAGTPDGTYCTGCATWRSVRGFLFDSRTIPQIARELLKVGA